MSPTSPPTSKLLIYAELLSNIRQISVIVALDVPCGPSTEAALSADGRQLFLHHDGETTTLKLPGQAVANLQLQKPILGENEISWRIPLAGQATRAGIEDAQSNEAPWSAKELSEDAEFSCRGCGSIILERGTIRVWKDLPSENWAEMMEFWHCHKPDVPVEEANGSSGQNGHVDAEETAVSKGYGASSKFIAHTKTGLIDNTTFLLASNDCTNLQITKSTDEHPAFAQCRQCHRNLGRDDPQSHGIRLFKWSCTLRSSNRHSPNNPSLSSFVSASCLSSIQANCLSKLVLTPQVIKTDPRSASFSSSYLEPSTLAWNLQSPQLPCVTSHSLSHTLSSSPAPLLVWVLQSSHWYCCSTGLASSASPSAMFFSNSAAPSNLSMKVFWKAISADQARNLLDGETAEELILPEDIVVEMGQILRDSARCLPPSARKFREWDVGLMERYQPSPGE